MRISVNMTTDATPLSTDHGSPLTVVTCHRIFALGGDTRMRMPVIVVSLTSGRVIRVWGGT